MFSLDAMRIPADRLTNSRCYLDPLNFATNFAFFRDAGGLHTRLVTANYWSGYGAGQVSCWMTLFAGDGRILAEWCQNCKRSASTIILDSREIRERFRLPEFCGQLFLHVTGAAGHDVVKYALDIFDGDSSANGGRGGTLPARMTPTLGLPTDTPAFPLPLPANRYCCGSRTAIRWRSRRAPSASLRWVRSASCLSATRSRLLPRALSRFLNCCPTPRGRNRSSCGPASTSCAHAMRFSSGAAAASRTSMSNAAICDPTRSFRSSKPMLGKGYLLPAPLMPRELWQSLVLPTPMAVCQTDLPIAALVYDPDGREVLRHSFGRLPRAHATALDLDEIEDLDALGRGYGHVELVYDFSGGGEGDGWLHALFRYRHRHSGHAAETSFGAHVFNTILTYRDEPQSYTGRPPGLSTRLFLRLGEPAYDTFCHLIYPASRPWLPASDTDIILYDSAGCEVARSHLAIPCSGSRLWYYRSLFEGATRARAGTGAYVIVRDTTCRLFGYHGLLGERWRLQPRPYVRILARARSPSRRYSEKILYIRCEIRGMPLCPSVTTARS